MRGTRKSQQARLRRRAVRAALLCLAALAPALLIACLRPEEAHPMYLQRPGEGHRNTPWSLVFCTSLCSFVAILTFSLSYFMIICSPWAVRHLHRWVFYGFGSPPAAATDFVQNTMVSIRGLRIYTSMSLSLFCLAVVSQRLFFPSFDERMTTGARLKDEIASTAFSLMPIISCFTNFKPSGYHRTSIIHSFLMSLLLISLAILVEKALIQRLAQLFHAANFSHRVEENNWLMSKLTQIKKQLGIRNVLQERMSVDENGAIVRGLHGVQSRSGQTGRYASFVSRPSMTEYTATSPSEASSPGSLAASPISTPLNPHVTVLRASGRRETLRRMSIYTGGIDTKLQPDIALIAEGQGGAKLGEDEQLEEEAVFLDEEQATILANVLYSAMKSGAENVSYLTVKDFEAALRGGEGGSRTKRSRKSCCTTPPSGASLTETTTPTR